MSGPVRVMIMSTAQSGITALSVRINRGSRSWTRDAYYPYSLDLYKMYYNGRESLKTSWPSIPKTPRRVGIFR